MMDHEEAMKMLEYFCKNGFYGLRGEEIGNDELMFGGTILGIDTCWVNDMKCYESAVVFKQNIFIAGRYETAEEARTGHKKLVEDALRSHAITFYDPQEQVIRQIVSENEEVFHL